MYVYLYTYIYIYLSPASNNDGHCPIMVFIQKKHFNGTIHTLFNGTIIGDNHKNE